MVGECRCSYRPTWKVESDARTLYCFEWNLSIVTAGSTHGPVLRAAAVFVMLDCVMTWNSCLYKQPFYRPMWSFEMCECHFESCGICYWSSYHLRLYFIPSQVSYATYVGVLSFISMYKFLYSQRIWPIRLTITTLYRSKTNIWWSL